MASVRCPVMACGVAWAGPVPVSGAVPVPAQPADRHRGQADNAHNDRKEIWIHLSIEANALEAFTIAMSRRELSPSPGGVPDPG